MKSITTFLLGAIIFVSTVYAEPQTASSPIKVGVILPLSGAFTRWGEKLQAALVKNKPAYVNYVFEDEGCDPARALTAYKSLGEFQGIKVCIGPWCGSPQVVVASQVKHKDQFVLLGSSAPQQVFALSGGKMYSSQHTIEAESTFLAERLNQAGIKSVVIVFQENQFSRAHESAFRKHFKGEIKAVALRTRQLGVDALYAPDAWPLMQGLARELKAVGLGGKPIYAVYSAQAKDVLDAMGEQGKNLFYSYLAPWIAALCLKPSAAESLWSWAVSAS